MPGITLAETCGCSMGKAIPMFCAALGGEDIFNMSFGIWKVQTDWVGAPHIHRSTGHTAGGSGYEGVM